MSSSDDDTHAPTALAPERKKKDKKSKKTSSKNGVKKQRKKRHDTFTKYIYALLKDNANRADIGLTKKSMMIFNDLCQQIFVQMIEEAAKLTRHGPRQTLTHHEVFAVAQLKFPPRLSEPAVDEGRRALANFQESVVA